MKRHREHLTCPGCAATWSPSRTTRFCGSCGSPVEPAAPVRALRPTVGCALALLLSAGLLGVGLAGGRIGTAPSATDRDAVELADPDDRGTGGDGMAAPCLPRGCVRWFAPVGPGLVDVADHGVFHLGTQRLTALAPDDGSVQWDVLLDGPDGAGPPVGGGLDVVDDLVVHRGHRWIRAHDAGTGAPRFATGLAPQRFPRAVTRTPYGLLVTGKLHADHHGSPYEFLALLDADDGHIRWSNEVHRVWVAPRGIVADAPADRRSVVDPEDGGLRVGADVGEVWREPGTVVVQPTRDVVGVLDLTDGARRWDRPLTQIAAHGAVELMTDRDGRGEVVDLISGRRRADGPSGSRGTPAAMPAVERHDDDLHLTGPRVTVVVSGPARVVWTEPLLVSTGEGLLAVDPTMLVGPLAGGPATR